MTVQDVQETPATGGHSGRFRRLDPKRQQLLQLLFLEQTRKAALEKRIPRRAPAKHYPLSFAQRRLWFLYRMMPASPYYNMPRTMLFKGSLRLAVLDTAIQAIVERHESLRTRFLTRDDEPVQVVLPRLAVPMPLVDLQALPGERREELARRLGVASIRQPFVLEEGPLVRVLLVRLAADEHVLFITAHHIVSDGWSHQVLFREMSQLYAAFAQGQPSPLPQLEIQYADFAVWQRGWLSEEMLDAQLDFWRHRMALAPALLELPTDRPRPPVQSLAGDHQVVNLPASLGAALQQASDRQGVLAYATLFSVFQTLLHRYTGVTDLVVGSPIANRNKAEVEGLIGFLVNMLLMRGDVSGDPPFRELLARTQKMVLQAYDHQDLPFEQLVESLQPERTASYPPLFQVMFNLLNFPIRRERLPSLEIAPWHLGTGTSKYDLSLYFFGSGESLSALLEYSTALFDRTTIRRMSGHLLGLLEAVVHDPDRRLSQLPMVPAAERHEILVERTAAPPAATEPPRTIHGLFEAQAARRPAALALEAGGDRLTYRELDRRAERLARRLRRLGVAPEVLVALALERSADMVVALLAILKAGGAYVPMDPSYPAARLATMVEDARPAVLVTRSPLKDSMPAAEGTVLCLDGDLGEVTLESDEPLVPIRPQQLAYVIFTSGSTGRPKGVAVTHGSAVNFLRSMSRRPGLDDHDVLLSVTTLSFDIAGLEIYLPLSVGARVVLASDEETVDGGLLARRIADADATALQATPATWTLLVSAGFAPKRDLRALCGGEALQRALADRLLARTAGVWNVYGPTETTVWSSVHRVRSAGGPMPLGRPIAGTAFYVAGRHGEPTPLGVPGELLIGGAGVARGYLGRPRLSAERFVPDPFAGADGGRLYRTGDLVRYRPAGSLEFLGRIDHQVKVRGFRIELGEVEAALSAHPAVRQAVAVAERRPDGGDRLAAYIVPRAVEPSVEALRAFLNERLPDYMVPSVFVVLESLPLTPSGKVDRRALPSPDAARLGLESEFREPATALERFIADGWRRVLGVERIGTRERFFDLGGNSIQAAIFVNALQQELGEIIHVTALFRAQSIDELVAFLQQEYPEAVQRFRRERGEGSAAPEMRRAPEEGIDSLAILEMRRRAAAHRRRRRGRRTAAAAKNPPAVFILSPPRAGSTLLRVMLAGHPRLFSPPELELLAFDTLGERAAELSDGHSFAREGLIRAVMELKGCDADQAKALLAPYEEQDMDVGRFYGLLREWSGGRTLVDKTSTYALDPAALARAEELFEAPLYVHLLRHPCATVKSYVDVRLDQFLRFDNPFTARQQAELLWVIDHQNILRFLAGIPAERQIRLRFEDLVRRPEEETRELCRFLGLDFEPEMLRPYTGRKMTDGIYAESRMHGDPRFHEHRSIEPAVTEKWRGAYAVEDLAELTRQMMTSFGYEAGRRRKEAAGGELSLVPLARQGGQPLSFAQERLWILDRFDPGTDAYNMTSTVKLRGKLDTAALERALTELVRRHAGLRTTFHAQAEGPVQVIHPPAPAALPRADLRRLDRERRQREARRLQAEEAAAPFDLSRGPLVRLRLLTLDDQEHVLQLNMHHIVSDGWSITVVTRELAALYGAYCLDEPSPLPEVTVQYADYAAWQRRWLSGRVLEEHLDYWRRQLGDLSAGLELPADRPRRAVRSYRGGHQGLTLSEELSGRLEELSRRHGVTLFMTLLAAFKVLLARWSGETDVAVGTPIATRRHPEVENLIGIFLNTLVLRTDLGGKPSFADALGRLREVALGAYAHQDLPFEKLLDELQPERDLSRTPLFQVFFNMVNLPVGTIEVPGLVIEGAGAPADAPSKFDLTLYAGQGQGRIGFSLSYNADLFAAWRMEELLAQYQILLERVSEDPARAVDAYSLHTPSAAGVLPDPRQELSHAWEGAAHELIARWAERDPQRLAVTAEDGRWTYRELAQASRRLAERLVAEGLLPGQTVAIWAHRSPALIWAIVGTLEAGGAFLLLDPAYPAPHQLQMLRLATPRVLLRLEEAAPVPEELARFFADLDHGVVVELPRWTDGAPELGSGAGAELPRVGPGDLAYVAFTSGSSGRPKGILGRHGPLTHFLPWQRQRFGLSESDRYSLLSGLAHDPLHRDVFTPLCLGASIVVPDPREMFTPGYLAGWMRRREVTVAHLTPAMAQLVTERAPGQEAARVPTLRRVFLIGDALTRRHVARLHDLAPEVRCVNLYGSTETQRAVGYHPVDPPAGGDGRDGAQVLPLGRGMEDVQLLVLNGADELAGLSEVGEISIRSPHLARGYLDDEEATRRRFTANPFTGRPDDRIYRTGDLGRYLPTGDVAFVGRADQQVKIRGFRVEVGEIEARLAEVEGVREAVVLPRGAAGDRRLVAYVVPEAGDELTVRDLRGALRRRLPQYMVPAGFVLLERLPLTPNGKLDRRALSRLRPAAAEAGTEHAPGNEMEGRIAGILKEVLEIGDVGVTESFFDLGANSLDMVRFHVRLQEALGREFSALEIFGHPSIRALADHLGEAAGERRPLPVEDREESLKKGRSRLQRRFEQRRTRR